MSDTYQKHIYEINIVECAYNVFQKLKSEAEITSINVDLNQYAYNLRLAIQEFKNSIEFDVKASQNARKQACVISTDHPAFDFWLGLHLSIEDADEIPLILDTYLNGDFGYIENFVGHVQFLVLKIMKTNIFFDYKAQKTAIINWAREYRAKQNGNVNEEKTIVNINNYQFNLIKNDVTINVEVLNQNVKVFNNCDFKEFNQYFNIKNQTQSEKNSDYKSNDNSKVENDEIISPPLELILLSLPYEEVFDYFMKLTNNPEKSKLTKEDIEYFVKSNFKFKHIQPLCPKKHLSNKYQKQHIIKLIHTFYSKIDDEHYNQKATLYCKLLIDNFTQFKNNKLENLKKNFSKPTTGYYPFN